MPGFKFKKKPQGGDLTGVSSNRQFKPQQDYAANQLKKRNTTKPDSDAQLTDYGLNKQVGESAIGRGDATKTTRFATTGQKNIMDVKGKAQSNASFKSTATEIATEKMPKDKAKSIATYAEGTSGIFSKKRREADHVELEAIDKAEATEAKPKKMNIFGKLKARQEAGNKLAESIDAEDYNSSPKSEVTHLETKKSSLSYSSKPTVPAKVTSNVESSFVGPTDNRPKSPIKSYSNSENTRMSTTKLDKEPTAEMRKVMSYQKKHGLKVDGVWSKGGETDTYYKNSLKAKSTSKKMNFNPEGSSVKKAVEQSKKSTSSKVPRLEYMGTDTPDYVYGTAKREEINSTKNAIKAIGSIGGLGDTPKSTSMKLKLKDELQSNINEKESNLKKKNLIVGEPLMKAPNKNLGKSTSTKKMNIKSTESNKESSMFNSIPNLDYSKFPKTNKPKEAKKEVKKESSDSGLGKYFNSIPNLDYSKFPKTKKK